MPSLHSLSISNCGLLKDVTLPFREGMTFLGGRNLDRNRSSGNAVGKSMLWSLLGGTIFQEQLWATQGVRNTNKTVMGDVSLAFSIGNNAYTLTQTSKGSKADYHLSKNGDSLDLHTLKNKTAAIAGLLPLTREHYISTVYIGGDSTPILRGSSSERINFFSNLWDFSSYQKSQEYFRRKRTALKEEVSRLSVYAEEAAKLSRMDTDALESDLVSIRSEIVHLRGLIEQDREERSKLDRYLQATALRPSLTRQECHRRLEEAQKGQEDFTLHNSRLSAWQQYRERYNALTSKLHNVPKPDLDALSDKQERIDHLKSVIAFWAKQTTNYERFKDHWKADAKAPVTPKQKERFASRRKAAKEAVTVLKADLDKLDNIKESETCPTCLTPLSSGHCHDMAASITPKLEKAEYQSLCLEAQAFFWAFSSYMDTSVEDATAESAIIKEEVTAITIQAKQYEEDQHTRSLLDNLTPCEKPDGDPVDRSADIRRLSRMLSDWDAYESSCHPFLTDGALEEAIKEKTESLSINEERLEMVIESDKSFSIALSEAKRNNEQMEALANQAARLPDAREELDMASWLYTQFSPKGIQQAYMQTVIGSYVRLLNEYYAMILPDPPEFSFYLEGNSFDILAKRNGGTTDIRTFSKSEGKQFCAVSALALRGILPPRFVLDTVIFDEVEEGMSEYERGVYVNQFLPFAATVVPKIVVVTPHLGIKDMLEGQAYVLERKGNKTRLLSA